jgi:hypothetical protein
MGLLLVAICSQVGHWMPAIVNSMIVSLGLAHRPSIRLGRFHQGAEIRRHRHCCDRDNAVLDDAASRM